MHHLMYLTVMVNLTAYAFTPPTAVIRPSKQSMQESDGFLIPSHVYVDLITSSKMIRNVHQDVVSASGDSLPAEDQPISRKSSHDNNRRRSSRRRERQPVRHGNLPNVNWRAVSMDKLRMHPQFDALPTFVDKIGSLEDVRNFRQDSWQWDALHEGRCTTSQVAAALGFLEPQAASVLQVPRSWRRGGISAYHRMCGSALRTLNEMRESLIETESSKCPVRASSAGREKIWAKPPSGHYPFAAKYIDRTEAPKKLEMNKAIVSNSHLVKMMWGSAQEATALLTALNYFYRSDPGVRLMEVGMCGAGLAEENSVLLGASPDALIRHSNGTVEVLEVKNHCPFFPSRRKGDANITEKSFCVKSFEFSEPYLQPLYVPQLMLEMLCSDCQSAIMVRQTATNGALIIRLQRNNEWINEMMYWLLQFQRQFVQLGVSPPSNFFWNVATTEEHLATRYRAFVQNTFEIARSVEVLAHVKNKDVQRLTGNAPQIMSLFLD